MAEEVQISPSAQPAKIRNPLGVLGLSLITLGIYGICWWYFINREMRDLGQARGVDLGQNPTNSVLAIIPGALIIVPAIVTYWNGAGRIEQSQRTIGMQQVVSGPIIFILMLLISPVGLWYAQNELNKVWEAQRAGGQLGAGQQAAQPQPGAPAEQPAQQPPAQGEQPPPGPPA
jgi:hypothetical protein